MAYDLSPEADAAALKARRAGLRDFSEEIADIVAKMPMPETYLEAERGARAVWVSDRVLVRMRVEMLGDGEESDPSGAARHLPIKDGEESDVPPPEPDAESDGWTMPYLMTPARLRLRNYADRLMECAANLVKPTCYLEGERAQRYALAADRMLGQLYAPPKPAKATGRDTFGDDDYDSMDRPAHDDLEAWQNILLEKLTGLARRYASDYGYWPNGAPYVEGEPEPEGSSPFNKAAYMGDAATYTTEKDVEIRIKGRAWYAQTHERESALSEAEEAELVAKIEADWDSGQLARDFPLANSHFSPLEGRRWREAPDEGLVPSDQVSDNPSSGSQALPPLPSSGERWESDDPPCDEGPSIRVVESIFAPSGPFGKRPCGCAISAPKCGGPCPIPP